MNSVPVRTGAALPWRSALLWLVAMLTPAATLGATPSIPVIQIRGAISPASSALFTRSLAIAQEAGAPLMVVQIDTPGGLDSSMREMIRAMLASPVPVAMYVAPSGARAASAGTYLMFAAHIAAMAPGTNLGAATPVAIGIGRSAEPEDKQAKNPGQTGAMERKAMHDASAYLRSLAQMRGRNSEWAEKAVLEAASLPAEEALAAKVIDLIADDVADLLRRIDGRTVKLGAREVQVALGGAEVRTLDANWKEQLLAIIADPNVALLLMMLGGYGLLFEFYSPGLALPGVVGGISLLLGFYGMALLPINYAGAALLILGVALMVAEAFVASFGALGIGGIAAFVAGALMLVDAEVPGLRVSLALVLPLAAASAAVLIGIGAFALQARRRPAVAGIEGMIGGKAKALADFAAVGQVSAFGEIWRARSSAPLARGEQATVRGVDGLTLVVEPDNRRKEDSP